MTARPRRRLASQALALAGTCVLMGIAACSGQVPATPYPTATSSLVSTPVAPASPQPTASPRTPAPAELQGKWRTVINDVDKPVLTITDFKYTLERLGMGTGSIEVRGDQIDFFGSNLCAGRGTYSWSIVDGTLTLAAVGSDPCANRADAIRNRPFTRLE